MNDRIIRGICIAGMMLSCGTVFSQESSPQTPESVRDLCDGPIDPLDISVEKTLFFSVAGPDNELDEKEFIAEQSSEIEKKFTRSFDKFNAMLVYDSDKNGRINWLEAEAYRQAIRERILKSFDTDNDGKLTGTERDNANRSLMAGELTNTKNTDAATKPIEEKDEKELSDEEKREKWMTKRFDSDGDGKISPAEQKRMDKVLNMREQRKKQMLARYDNDGDGQLSQNERHLAKQEMSEPWEKITERMKLQHFDENGDGKINEDEKAAIKEFQVQVKEVAKIIKERVFDTDGDGKVTKEERVQAIQGFIIPAMRLRSKFEAMQDTDGNGEVTFDERMEFSDKARKGMEKWVDDFFAGFDANGDNRLDSAERPAMLEGFVAEFDNRARQYDANENGNIDPAEMVAIVEGFMGEMGMTAKDDSTPVKENSKNPAKPQAD